MPTNVRWIAQKNTFSCGPVAILNVLKWAGFPISYKKDYNFWKKKCKCSNYGTHQPKFQDCLQNLKNISAIPKNLPTISFIEDILQSNQIVIMKSTSRITSQRDLGHFFLIVEMTEDSFFIVNDIEGKHQWYDKEIFAAYYLQYHREYCDTCCTSSLCGVSPYAWCIKKLYQ